MRSVDDIDFLVEKKPQMCMSLENVKAGAENVKKILRIPSDCVTIKTFSASIYLKFAE